LNACGNLSKCAIETESLDCDLLAKTRGTGNDEITCDSAIPRLFLFQNALGRMLNPGGGEKFFLGIYRIMAHAFSF